VSTLADIGMTAVAIYVRDVRAHEFTHAECLTCGWMTREEIDDMAKTTRAAKRHKCASKGDKK